jgi:hypothetical protein
LLISVGRWTIRPGKVKGGLPGFLLKPAGTTGSRDPRRGLAVRSAELELTQGQVEGITRTGDGEVEQQGVEAAVVEEGDRVAA